jgi:hypothetical protein
MAPHAPEQAAAMVNAHVLGVWNSLTDPERARASLLIARLTPDERTAWVGELASLPLPDAIARLRSILGPPAPPTPTVPSTTPEDKSP